MPSDYTPQTWHDLPATDTPISAARLGVLEAGLGSHTHPDLVGGGGGGADGAGTRFARLDYRRGFQVGVPAGFDNVDLDYTELFRDDAAVWAYYPDGADWEYVGGTFYSDNPVQNHTLAAGGAEIQLVYAGVDDDLTVTPPDPADVFTATITFADDDVFYQGSADMAGAAAPTVALPLWLPAVAFLNSYYGTPWDGIFGLDLPFTVDDAGPGVNPPFRFDATINENFVFVDEPCLVWAAAWLSFPNQTAPPADATVDFSLAYNLESAPFSTGFTGTGYSQSLVLTPDPDGDYSTGSNTWVRGTISAPMWFVRPGNIGINLGAMNLDADIETISGGLHLMAQRL